MGWIDILLVIQHTSVADNYYYDYVEQLTAANIDMIIDSTLCISA